MDKVKVQWQTAEMLVSLKEDKEVVRILSTLLKFALLGYNYKKLNHYLNF